MESAIPAQSAGQAVPEQGAPESSGGKDSQRVLSNSLIVMTRQAFLWGLNALLLLFLPTYLGAEGMGQLQFTLSFTALVAVGTSLGYRQFITKEVARDTSNAAYYFGASMGLRILLTLASIVVTVIVVEAIGYETDLKQVLYLGTAAIIALNFAKMLIAYLWGYEDMRGPAKAEISSKIFGVAAGIPVLILTESVLAYVGVLLASNVLQGVVAAWYVRKRVPLRVSFERTIMWKLTVGGLPFLLMLMILELYAHADVITLRAFTNDEVTGWYAAALNFYKAAELFPVAITTALLPTLSRLHTSDGSVLADISRKSIGIVAAVVLPGALALSLLSEFVITLLPYDATFNNSIASLTILALTIPLTAFLTVLGTIAISADRQKAMAWALGATLIFDIILNILLIPYFQDEYGNGGIGAAIATLAAEVVMIAIAVKIMPKGVFDRRMNMMLGKIVFSAAVLAGIGALAFLIDIHALITVTLGGIAYVGLIFGLKVFTPAEVINLLNTVRGRGGSTTEEPEPEAQQ